MTTGAGSMMLSAPVGRLRAAAGWRPLGSPGPRREGGEKTGTTHQVAIGPLARVALAVADLRVGEVEHERGGLPGGHDGIFLVKSWSGVRTFDGE
jgi:hypothetical protein